MKDHDIIGFSGFFCIAYSMFYVMGDNWFIPGVLWIIGITLTIIADYMSKNKLKDKQEEGSYYDEWPE